MNPVCKVCGVRSKNVPCDVIKWRCTLCMTKQEQNCNCDLCQGEAETFHPDVIEFKPYFELGE